MLSQMGWLDWYSKSKVASLKQSLNEARRYSPSDNSLEEIAREISFRTGNTKEMKAPELIIYKERRE